MTEHEFREELNKASRLVSTWPAWKRNLLEQSASSTVLVPRTPVDNNRQSLKIKEITNEIS